MNKILRNSIIAAIVLGTVGTSSFYNYTYAKGEDAVEEGNGAKADGEYSVAIGSDAKAQDAQSVAIGASAETIRRDSVAIGTAAKTLYEESIAIGYHANVYTGNSIALGQVVGVTGTGSVVIGSYSKVRGDHSIGIGDDVNVGAVHSVAMGSGATVEKYYSVAIGSGAHTEGSSSVAIGLAASTVGKRAVGLGMSTFAKGEGSIALGSYSVANDSYEFSVGKDEDKDEDAVHKDALYRRITHVADGVKDHDAVTVEQLKTKANVDLDNLTDTGTSKVKSLAGEQITATVTQDFVTEKVKKGNLTSDTLNVTGTGKLVDSDLKIDLKDGSVTKEKLANDLKTEIEGKANTSDLNKYVKNTDLSSYAKNIELAKKANVDLDNLTTAGTNKVKTLAGEQITATVTQDFVTEKVKKGSVSSTTLDVTGTGKLVDSDLIIDLKDGSVTKGKLSSDLQTEIEGKANTSDLNKYVKNTDLSSYAKTSDLNAYAKNTELAKKADTNASNLTKPEDILAWQKKLGLADNSATVTPGSTATTTNLYTTVNNMNTTVNQLKAGYTVKAGTNTFDMKLGDTTAPTIEFAGDSTNGLDVAADKAGKKITYAINKDKLVKYIAGDLIKQMNGEGTPGSGDHGTPGSGNPSGHGTGEQGQTTPLPVLTNVSTGFNIAVGTDSKNFTFGKGKETNKLTFAETKDETVISLTGEDGTPTITVGLADSFKTKVENKADKSELSSYAKTSDLSDYAKSTELAKKADTNASNLTEAEDILAWQKKLGLADNSATVTPGSTATTNLYTTVNNMNTTVNQLKAGYTVKAGTNTFDMKLGDTTAPTIEFAGDSTNGLDVAADKAGKKITYAINKDKLVKYIAGDLIKQMNGEGTPGSGDHGTPGSGNPSGHGTGEQGQTTPLPVLTNVSTGFNIAVGDNSKNFTFGKGKETNKLTFAETKDETVISLTGEDGTPTITVGLADTFKTKVNNKADKTTVNTLQRLVSLNTENVSKKADKDELDALKTKVNNITDGTTNIDVKNIDLSTNNTFKTLQNTVNGKADADGSNVTTPATWAEKLGTGKVAENNKELVTGGTVHTALKGKADKNAENIEVLAWKKKLGLVDAQATQDSTTNISTQITNISNDITNLKGGFIVSDGTNSKEITLGGTTKDKLTFASADKNLTATFNETNKTISYGVNVANLIGDINKSDTKITNVDLTNNQTITNLKTEIQNITGGSGTTGSLSTKADTNANNLTKTEDILAWQKKLGLADNSATAQPGSTTTNLFTAVNQLKAGYTVKAGANTFDMKLGDTAAPTIEFAGDSTNGLDVKADSTGKKITYTFNKGNLVKSIAGDLIKQMNGEGTPGSGDPSGHGTGEQGQTRPLPVLTNVSTGFNIAVGNNSKNFTFGKGKETNKLTFAGTNDETSVSISGEDGTPTITVGLADTFKTKVNNKADRTTVNTLQRLVSLNTENVAKKADKDELEALKTKVTNITDGTTKIDVKNIDLATNNTFKTLQTSVEGKANKNADNITVSDWATKLGTGEVATGNANLVTGGKVFDAIKDKADKSALSDYAKNSAVTELETKVNNITNGTTNIDGSKINLTTNNTFTTLQNTVNGKADTNANNLTKPEDILAWQKKLGLADNSATVTPGSTATTTNLYTTVNNMNTTVNQLKAGYTVKAGTNTFDMKLGDTTAPTIEFAGDSTNGLDVAADKAGKKITYAINKDKLVKYIAGDLIKQMNGEGTPGSGDHGTPGSGNPSGHGTGEQGQTTPLPVLTNVSTGFNIAVGTDSKNFTFGKGKETNKLTFAGTNDETSVSISGEDGTPTITVGLADTFKTKVNNKADRTTVNTLQRLVSLNTENVAKKADKDELEALKTKVTNITNGTTKIDVKNIDLATNNTFKELKTSVEGKANADGSNVTTPATWATKLGTGKVAENNKELVTGGTVHTALQGKADTNASNLTKAEDILAWKKKLGLVDAQATQDSTTNISTQVTNISNDITNLKGGFIVSAGKKSKEITLGGATKDTLTFASADTNLTATFNETTKTISYGVNVANLIGDINKSSTKITNVDLTNNQTITNLKTEIQNITNNGTTSMNGINFYLGGTSSGTTYTPSAKAEDTWKNSRIVFGEGLKAEKLKDAGDNEYTRISATGGGQGGKSAYEIWRDHKDDKGLTPNSNKSETEFLDSLKGQSGIKGEDGKDGKSAYEVWRDYKEGNDSQPNKGKSEKDFMNYMKGKDCSADIQHIADNVTKGLSAMDGRMNSISAGAAALSALHPVSNEYNPDDKLDFSVGFGHYRGENAVAIGAYYRPNPNMMVSLGSAFNGYDNLLNAGLSWKLGKGNEVAMLSKKVLLNEVIRLTKINKEMAAKIELQEEKIAHQESMISEQDARLKKIEALLAVK